MKYFLLILILLTPLTTHAMNKAKHPRLYREQQRAKAKKEAKKGSANESKFMGQIQALRVVQKQNPWTEAASEKTNSKK